MFIFYINYNCGWSNLFMLTSSPTATVLIFFIITKTLNFIYFSPVTVAQPIQNRHFKLEEVGQDTLKDCDTYFFNNIRISKGKIYYLFGYDQVRIKPWKQNKITTKTMYIRRIDSLGNYYMEPVKSTFCIKNISQYWFRLGGSAVCVYDSNFNVRWITSYGNTEKIMSDKERLNPINRYLNFENYNPYCALVDPIAFDDDTLYMSLRIESKNYFTFLKDTMLIHPTTPIIGVIPLKIPQDTSLSSRLNLKMEYTDFCAFWGERDSTPYKLIKENKWLPEKPKVTFSLNPKLKKIFVNYSITPTINVYDYKGNCSRKFGSIGRYMDDSLDTIAYILPQEFEEQVKQIKDEKALKKTVARIRFVKSYYSYQYDYIYNDKIKNLTFRSYRTAGKDIQYNTKTYFDTLKTPLNYYELLLLKPTYLQIYDHNNNDALIYDEPVPAPFKVLEVDAEGYLWAVAGRSGDNLIIRKYKIVRE